MAKHKFDPDKEREKERGRTNPTKSRITSYPKIKNALTTADFGSIFTTPQSDDIYVITHGTWGSKSGNKVVKSFPPDTPYAEIKGYSDRTKVKHGSKSKGRSDSQKEESGFAVSKNSKDSD